MASTALMLQVALALGFGAVALRGIAVYRRYRARARGYLAFALGALGLVPVLGAVRALTSVGEPVLADATIVAFLLSGYGLLLFRHAFVPLSRPVRLGLLGAVVAAAGVAVAFPFERPLSSVELLLALGVLSVWPACVVEPIYRFWTAARGRPRVQRRRLRSVSLAYLCIVLVLAMVFVSLAVDLPAAADLIRPGVGLLVIPVLYLGFAPPGWVRRLWREPEEVSFRTAMEDLIVRSATREELACRAIAWAERLVGAEASFLIDGEGVVLGSHGLDEATINRIVDAARWKGEGLVFVDDEAVGGAIAVALSTSGARGWIGVISGPFTPLFGTDEVEQLRHYAVSVAVALDRVALTEQVRDQTVRYEAILRSMGDLGIGFVIGDGERIVHANRAICELTGYSEEELRQRPFADLLAPVSRAEVVERARRRATGHEEVPQYDAVVLRRDGALVDVAVGAQRLGEGEGPVIGIIQDISERKRAEADIRRQKEFAERVIASSIDGIVAFDHEFRYTIWNRGMEKISGMRAEDVLGRNAFEVFPFLAEIGEDVHMRRALEGHASLVEDRRYSVPETEREGFFEARYVPLREADDEIIGGLGVVRDVTEQKRVIERLRGLNEMKDVFLTAVSHELRTPLTAVMGFAETMRTSIDELSSERRTDFLDRLIQNAQRLDRLLGDLLDVGRLTRGLLSADREQADLGAVVLRTVERSGLLDGHRLSVEVESVVVPIDVPKIERCLENLLANAEKHTPSGTDVWVRVRARPGGALLIVEDAGPGVPDDQKEHIFGMFQHGEDVPAHAPGIGIGLALTARLVDLHGGRIWVEDRRGGGASFRAFFPDVEAPPGVPLELEIGTPDEEAPRGAELRQSPRDHSP